MTQLANNKKTIERLLEAYNARDPESFKSAYADEILIHTVDGDVTHDVDEHWQGVLDMIEVFPDHRATIESLVAEGDRVFVRYTYAGTHEGTLHGFEPTGTYIEFPHFVEFRLEDGVMVEAWPLTNYHDLYEKLRQNGTSDHR